MKRRIISALLSLAIVLALLPAAATPAGAAAVPDARHWFYNQLTDQGKDIYNAMVRAFSAGRMKDGRKDLDLSSGDLVSQAAIKAYLDSDRTLFNDFAAAKDAFDLEHPEAWYVDSSYLAFRVTRDKTGRYHAYVGSGDDNGYYVSGIRGESDVNSKDASLRALIDDIAEGARGSTAEKIRYVHNEIVSRISYRYENECTQGNEGYIRTSYALATHQGVCEGYCRAFQWVMNELNIPCVLIHGLQTSGQPESHMWAAVYVSGATGTGWYAVDPTWDDPVPLDSAGRVKRVNSTGTDGGEHEGYLLVGQDVIAENWRPSGYVSTGMMEFSYPAIAQDSYGGGRTEDNGLKVLESPSGMEGVPATKYTVSFKGMGAQAAANAGFYFLVKMYDVNADGSMDTFDDWYYPIHMLYAINGIGKSGTGNSNFYDEPKAMTMVLSQAEYVEFAITTKAPPAWKNSNDLLNLGGYFSGSESDIIAQTGLIFNYNGGYEAPPYVKNASPRFNSPVYVGQNYTVHLEFTDPLYRPGPDDLAAAEQTGKTGNLHTAVAQNVTLDYTGTTYSWGVNQRQPHAFASRPEPKNVRWVCETHGEHSGMEEIDNTCRLTTLEYEFSASRMWADDSIQYEFFLTGLVGIASNKAPCTWSYVFENYSAYCSYRAAAGIDWNLWGQPRLLDNPGDLDLGKIALEGVDGSTAGSLDALRSQMHLDRQDMNGRLTLVVEDLGSNRDSYQDMTEAIEDKTGISGRSIKAASLYEIDFARICAKTVVKTGQSLRLQVGFPEGIGPNMAGLTFKAYHFVRDIEGSCNIKGAGHVHTGLVTKVEEIPVTVTEYGLILMVSSFSPFEIIAVTDPLGELDNSIKNTVSLATDGHGDVSFDRRYALVRSDTKETVANTAQLEPGDTVSFTVKPDAGYELDSVTFCGLKTEKIVPDEKGVFTISYEQLDQAANGNAIVNVAFLPATVAKADADRGESSVTPAVAERSIPGAPAHVASDFSDVKPADWYYEGVNYAVRRGLMSGVASGKFDPTGTASRGQIVALLYHLDGDPKTSAPAFDDVHENDYYAKGVAWAASNGIVSGVGNNKFDPLSSITRQQAATILYNYAKHKGYSVSARADLTKYGDADSISPWCVEAMSWANAVGLVAGSDDMLMPASVANRATLATMLMKFCQLYLD